MSKDYRVSISQKRNAYPLPPRINKQMKRCSTSQGNNKNNTLVKNKIIFHNLLTISEKMSQWKLSPTTGICVHLYSHYGTYLGNFRLKWTVSMATQKPTFRQFPRASFRQTDAGPAPWTSVVPQCSVLGRALCWVLCSAFAILQFLTVLNLCF